MKRYFPMAIAVFLVVFLAVPFWGIIRLPEQAAYIAQSKEVWTAAQMQKCATTHTVNSIYGAGELESACVIFVGIGFLAALLLFSHLQSRRQAMLAASQPVSPVTDFLHRSFVFTVLVLPAAILALAVLPVTCAALGIFSLVDWSLVLAKCGVLLLLIVYGYALGTLASVLTGRVFATVLGGAVLGLSGEGVCGLGWRLARQYLVTMPDNGFSGSKLFAASPAYALYKNLYKPGVVNLLPGLVAIILFFALALWLSGKRRVERAGKTIAFPIAERILEFYLPLVGGVLALPCLLICLAASR